MGPRRLAGVVLMGALGSALFGLPSPADDGLDAARATLARARTTLLAKLDAAKVNSDDPYDVVYRLDAALRALDPSRAATEVPDAADAELHARLDAAWIDALTSGACPAPAAAGASETCFRATSDETLQPLAVYIPATLGPGSRAPLVVLLRGRGETESDILSRSEIRALAESSGAILAAPYARGQARYDARATRDVIDALDAAQRFFATDARRVYIAGFSMGGMAAFHVAASAPRRFAAVLSVVGGLQYEDREAMRSFAPRPVYVVNAAHDQFVPAEFGHASVRYLNAAGIPALYYESTGTHSLRSVEPAMRQAWHDMFAGVIAPPDDNEAAPVPFPTGKPASVHPT